LAGGSNEPLTPLEQLAERRPAELTKQRLGDEKVPALDRSVKGRSRMSLRCDAVPAFPGPDGRYSLFAVAAAKYLNEAR
jgi:hypothetical protein